MKVNKITSKTSLNEFNTIARKHCFRNKVIMTKNRLEAFSDGVLAIIITIMVLELKVPHGTDLASLQPVLPFFIAYILSFIYLAIYWNNHHHMLHTLKYVSGSNTMGQHAFAFLALFDTVYKRAGWLKIILLNYRSLSTVLIFLWQQ
jgi:uncharacterized membrane protein